MRIWKVALLVTLMPWAAAASFLACSNAPLTSYLNGGAPYLCTEAGGVAIGFNQNLLASYVGLNILSANNSAATTGSINVIPGASSLDFRSSSFTESSSVLSSQAELVQFNAYSPGIFNSTTFQLDSPQVSDGLGLGTGVIVGQELVCVGGNFTSLPVGLVTSIANGVLGSGYLGCNGTTLVGTAATDIGLLSAVTSLAILPPLTGLTDTATIQLTPYNTNNIDVIKIQDLLSTTGGSAITAGFGDTFAVTTPEPGSLLMLALGAAMIGLTRTKARPEKS